MSSPAQTCLSLTSYTSGPQFTVGELATAARCEWYFLRRISGFALEDTDAFRAHVQLLSHELFEEIVQDYRRRRVRYRSQINLGARWVRDEVPLMVHTREGWVVQLARYSAHVRLATRLKLAGYVWLCRRHDIQLAPVAQVIQGTGRIVQLDTEELCVQWEQTLSQALELCEKWSGCDFTRDMWRGVRACGSCPECEVAARRFDDPILVSGLGPKIRCELQEHGIFTREDLLKLADVDSGADEGFASPSPSVSRETQPGEESATPISESRPLPPLRQIDGWKPGLLSQTLLQFAQDRNLELPLSLAEKLGLEVEQSVDEYHHTRVLYALDRAALNRCALPEPAVGDVYLDFENNSLWGWSERDHNGMVFLSGAFTLENGDLRRAKDDTETSVGASCPLLTEERIAHLRDNEQVGAAFASFWAHSWAGEERMFNQLVSWLRSRLETYPDLHIYHYSGQERLYLRRLAKKYPRHGEFVEELLKANTLIDLQEVVFKCLKTGQRGYSLKDLEPLYVGRGAWREELDNGAESLALFDSLQREGKLARGRSLSAQTENILRQIEQYNAYDCVSTYLLHRWLCLSAGVQNPS